MSTISASDIAASVERLFWSHGLPPRREYVLPNGRRLDVAAFGKNGDIAGVEVKMTERDFNRDLKWPVYLPFCRAFYFAVPLGFNIDILPVKLGLIVSNGTNAKLMRGMSGRYQIAPNGLLRA